MHFTTYAKLQTFKNILEPIYKCILYFMDVVLSIIMTFHKNNEAPSLLELHTKSSAGKFTLKQGVFGYMSRNSMLQNKDKLCHQDLNQNENYGRFHRYLVNNNKSFDLNRNCKVTKHLQEETETIEKVKYTHFIK